MFRQVLQRLAQGTAISPSNWVFPGQWCFRRMTNCSPKVSRLAVADLERMAPQGWAGAADVPNYCHGVPLFMVVET